VIYSVISKERIWWWTIILVPTNEQSGRFPNGGNDSRVPGEDTKTGIGLMQYDTGQQQTLYTLVNNKEMINVLQILDNRNSVVQGS